jgi:hypothetical protein
MKSREELIRGVETRNQIRAEAGLPLVAVEVEMEKIHQAELQVAYRHWYSTDALPKIKDELLERSARTGVIPLGSRVAS